MLDKVSSFFDSIPSLIPAAEMLYLTAILGVSALLVIFAIWIAQLLERNVSVEASRLGPEPIIRGRAVLGCVMLMLSLSLLMGMVPGSRPMHLPTALATMGCACVALSLIATSFRDSKRARIERQRQLDEELGPPLKRAA